jgi:hypothetical protein
MVTTATPPIARIPAAPMNIYPSPVSNANPGWNGVVFEILL